MGRKSTASKGKSPVALVPPRQRSRIGQGKNILPPSKSMLGGNLNFKTKKAKARYELLCDRNIIPCKYVHYPTLDKLMIRADVDKLIDKIGWRIYFSVNCPAFIELTREFYTTFQFTAPPDLTLNTPKVVQFRLLGKEFAMSITEFNLAFGFIDDNYAKTPEYHTASCDFSPEFEPSRLWKHMSTDAHAYDSSQSKSSYLRDPVLKYIQRFFAYNFSGRKDSSGTFSKVEFYFVWCMLNDVKVNLGSWLATQFQSIVNKKRPLILGSYITHLAINLGLLNLENNDMHIACEMEPLDIDCLIRMGVVAKTQGEISFNPLRPTVLPRIQHAKRSRTVANEATHEVNDIHDTPSSSAVPTQDQYGAQLQRIERRLFKMEQNFAAYLASVGFQPPYPPSL